MLRRVWKLALGLAVAAGCYSSGGQTKDGQSHWLDMCSTQSDCADDQICACGVCTIACVDDDACGAAASCEPVEDRAACESAPSRADRVCLRACASAAMCEDVALSCVSQACVASEPGAIAFMSSPWVEPPSIGAPITVSLNNGCDAEGAFEPLDARDGETCYDLIMHNGDGVAPFEIPLDESLHHTYYVIPWPEGSVATRFGFQQDDTTSLHRALLFEALGGSDGLLERNVTGWLDAQDAKLIAGWSTSGCNVELPHDVGVEVTDPGGDKNLLIQWHYFNLTNESQRDSSRFQVCVVPRTARANIAGMTVLGTEDLGGQEGMPVGQPSTFGGDCMNKTEDEIWIATYWPHMHELGRSWHIGLVSDSGSNVGTYAESRFEHESNGHYMREQPLPLSPGQTLRASCTYFNDRSYNAIYGTSLVFEQCYQHVYAYPAGALDKPDNPSLLGATNTCWGD